MYHFQWQEHAPHGSLLVKMDTVYPSPGIVMVIMTVATSPMNNRTVFVSPRAAYK